jgi:hypothetical protein
MHIYIQAYMYARAHGGRPRAAPAPHLARRRVGVVLTQAEPSPAGPTPRAAGRAGKRRIRARLGRHATSGRQMGKPAEALRRGKRARQRARRARERASAAFSGEVGFPPGTSSTRRRSSRTRSARPGPRTCHARTPCRPGRARSPTRSRRRSRRSAAPPAAAAARPRAPPRLRCCCRCGWAGARGTGRACSSRRRTRRRPAPGRGGAGRAGGCSRPAGVPERVRLGAGGSGSAHAHALGTRTRAGHTHLDSCARRTHIATRTRRNTGACERAREKGLYLAAATAGASAVELAGAARPRRRREDEVGRVDDLRHGVLTGYSRGTQGYARSGSGRRGRSR